MIGVFGQVVGCQQFVDPVGPRGQPKTPARGLEIDCTRDLGMCRGDARPSRNQAVAMFVEWAGNNPDSAGTEALGGVLTGAAAACPCN